MFEQLSDNLQNTFKSFRGQSHITEENIDTAIREVKRALINSDVSLKAVKTFTARVKEKAIGEEVLKGIKPEEQFIKIINDEITSLLGNEQQEINLPNTEEPNVVLALGLQGAGKTTSCAKLGLLLKKKGRNPLLVPLDLKRPAAIEQLTVLGKELDIAVFEVKEKYVGGSGEDPLNLAKEAVDFAKSNNHDVVILDSAGRLQVDTELMSELLIIDRVLKPTEKLLVIDSMIGQEAANVAAAFNTQIGVTGILLTKLDGDARGGAALSVVEEIKKPIKFAGIGEKPSDLQEFHPDRVSSRILGMGDVLTLVEKAQEDIDEEEALDFQKQLAGDFNFETFLKAQKMMGKLGNFSHFFDMMGMGGVLNKLGMELDKDNQQKMLAESEVKMARYKAAIQSMTKEEKLNPDLLNMSRKVRIAKGSGFKQNDIDQLVKDFKVMKKMMNGMKPLMSMMQGGSPEGGGGMDMLKNMIPGGSKQGGGNRASRRLSKGFKPKKRR